MVLICSDGASLYDICGNMIDIGRLWTIYRFDYTNLYWQDFQKSLNSSSAIYCKVILGLFPPRLNYDSEFHYMV